MLPLVLASINVHIVQACNLSGQAIGVMGALFGAYDLLGRPGGPLRWILRIAIPGFISTAILLTVALFAIVILRPSHASAVNIASALGIFGAILGVFNGIFVAAPGTAGYKGTFSIRDALIGALVAAAIFSLDQPIGIIFTPPTIADLYAGIITVCLSAIAAGLWRRLNRWSPEVPSNRQSTLHSLGLLLAFFSAVLAIVLLYLTQYHTATSLEIAGFIPGYVVLGCVLWFMGSRQGRESGATTAPGLYNRRGARIGLLAGFIMVFAIVFLYFIIAAALGKLFAFELLPFAFAATIYAAISSIGGAISGGLTQYIFWKVNTLPDRGMEVIGLFLILVAFGVQVIQPVFGLLGVPIQ